MKHSFKTFYIRLMLCTFCFVQLFVIKKKEYHVKVWAPQSLSPHLTFTTVAELD